ncbi:flagellar hook-length control protein FliK [Cognatiluteimonas weifangensis]|uniref:Flagellar hook-length control protein FliK n=1 Tax=Cognatiluteimonas weifangensis TaxID=2303539 RepID=A0A372DR42_9GAMM|nr:flagellar hook-length control protein FliK [Luteimonas weifangensis]RFP62045.1 flagellar hook-length control protein FliK [Luteimonas weifangensis]
MIGAALPATAAPVPASAPGADAAAQAPDMAAATAGDGRTPAHAGTAPSAPSRDGGTTPAGAPDAIPPRRGHFARLLDPAPTATPATPAADAATPEPAAPSQATATALPDQLLDLFALLAPGAPVPGPGTAPMQDGEAATPLAATLPPAAALPAVAPVPAGVPGTTTAVGTPGAQDALASPAARIVRADTDAAPGRVAPAPWPMPSSSATAATGGHTAATADPALLRLVADTGIGAAGPQADPAPTQPLLATQPPALAPATARMPMVPSAPLPQPADAHTGYGDEFGNSVLWMTGKALGHAQLRVTPEHLGPIDVRLQLDGARVHAEFTSAQPEVRQALEASLPRLREMLGQHGLDLAQADVGQRQPNPRPAPTTARAPGDPALMHDDPAPAVPRSARSVRGLLDEYA